MNKKILISCILLSLIILILPIVKSDEPYMEVLLVNPDSGVQYQSKILEELNKSSEVAIIVKLHFKNMTKVDEVIATLPETEFNLEGKFLLGNGFYGNITKRGFDILINNPDVAEIHSEIIAHTLPAIEIKEEVREGRIKDDSNIIDATKNDSTSKDLIEEDKIIQEKEHESLFSRIIQFLKSLLGFKSALSL